MLYHSTNSDRKNNGFIPGPTLIVNEGQVVIVNVLNRLISESTSLHWHGMDRRKGKHKSIPYEQLRQLSSNWNSKSVW